MLCVTIGVDYKGEEVFFFGFLVKNGEKTSFKRKEDVTNKWIYIYIYKRMKIK